jgi:hypothetical protein
MKKKRSLITRSLNKVLLARRRKFELLGLRRGLPKTQRHVIVKREEKRLRHKLFLYRFSYKRFRWNFVKLRRFIGAKGQRFKRILARIHKRVVRPREVRRLTYTLDEPKEYFLPYPAHISNKSAGVVYRLNPEFKTFENVRVLRRSYEFKFGSFKFSHLFMVRAFVSSFSRAWNPLFFRFILGSRHRKFTILNHLTVYFALKRNFFFLREVLACGGKFLILNPAAPKRFTYEPMGLVTNTWVPGMLTNTFALQRISLVNQIKFFLPVGLIYMSNQLKLTSFLLEAKKLRMPIFAFVESYFANWIVDYPMVTSTAPAVLEYYQFFFNTLYGSVYNFMAYRYAIGRDELATNDSIFKRRVRLLRRRNIAFLRSYLKSMRMEIERPKTKEEEDRIKFIRDRVDFLTGKSKNVQRKFENKRKPFGKNKQAFKHKKVKFRKPQIGSSKQPVSMFRTK